MVPSTINEKYAGKVIWMDRNGLVEDSFTKCAISLAWERDRYGRMRVFYKPLNQNLPELTRSCGISKPDQVFELEKFEGQAENQGFDVVFAQRGTIGAGLPGELGFR